MNYCMCGHRQGRFGGILSGFHLQTYFAIYIGILIFGASESQVSSKRASWANVEGVGDTSDFKLWGGLQHLDIHLHVHCAIFPTLGIDKVR